MDISRVVTFPVCPPNLNHAEKNEGNKHREKWALPCKLAGREIE